MKPMRPLAAVAAVSALTLGACASLEPPRLQVMRLGLDQMGITGAVLDVDFAVFNPNPDPVLVERFEYELLLNEWPVGFGVLPNSVGVSGYGQERVRSRFDLNLLRMGAAIKSVLDQDRVQARVRGTAHVRRGSKLRRMRFGSDASVSLRKGPLTTHPAGGAPFDAAELGITISPILLADGDF
jgi:LEA14-like dessication related protein